MNNILNEYSGICNNYGTIIAKEMKLNDNKFAKETRKKFCDNVEYTFIRAYNGNWKDFGKKRFISCSLSGNLASWFANELNINDYAPITWRDNVVDFMYKRYGV